MFQQTRRLGQKVTASGSGSVNIALSQQTQKHLHDICTMLDQRRRRWAHVVQMLYK